MTDQLKIVNLKCPNCGGVLEISGDRERFACGYCGSEQSVELRGGTIGLKLVDAVSRIQVGTDKTAALKLMKNLILLMCCIILSYSTGLAQRKEFVSKQHRISASIPDGWDEVQGIRDNTVLKLARSGRSEQRARIAVVLQTIPKDLGASDYEIWSMSNDDIRKAVFGETTLGENVTVVDLGRGTIDGIHFIWTKNLRHYAGNEFREFVYQGIRGSQFLTIRLFSYGDKDWFAANQSIFADFVRTLRIQ